MFATLRVVAVLAVVIGLLAIPDVAFAEDGQATVLSVYEPGGLSAETIEGANRAALSGGARALVVHRGTIQLRRVTRGDVVIQEPPPGFTVPMSAMAVEPDGVALGAEIASALVAGHIVFGETSARLRGVEVGDTVEFVGWDQSIKALEVGAIAPDEDVAWSEMVFSDVVAAQFGFDRPSSMRFWGFASQDEFVISLWASLPDVLLRVSSSDDPANPDSVLPTVLVKERFGEFSYRPTGDGDRIVIDPAWRDANIVQVDLPLLGPFRCHRAMIPFLRSAIAEVVEAGLWGQIDRADFQLAGGCYNPRLIRGGDKGGAVSRHSWGIAVDINPSSNRYGGVVRMPSAIGEIFRSWGFAWGGGWTYTDGGHFEWTHVPIQILEG